MKKYVIIVTLLILVGIGIGSYSLLRSGLEPVNPDDDAPISVNVESGMGEGQIISLLYESGLIKNENIVKIYLKLNPHDTLQANSYVLNKSMSTSEIFDIINNGTFEYVSTNRFTIFEGATFDVAAEAIAVALEITPEEVIATWNDRDFLNELTLEYSFLTDEIFQESIRCPLDGFLYPDTYFITEQEKDVKQVTRHILDVFESKIEPLLPQIEASGYTLYEFVTFASVVEAETLFAVDTPKIAGVFQQRLNIGMNLESCSTALYAKGEKRVYVTIEDTEYDSLYNTYMYGSLPIGPICNPSIPTMEACLNPEITDDLYFFAKEDGTVLYSSTYQEHLDTVNANLWY